MRLHQTTNPSTPWDHSNLRKCSASITIKMLLNHISGLSYHFNTLATYDAVAARVHPFYRHHGVFDIPHLPDQTSDELLKRLSKYDT